MMFKKFVLLVLFGLLLSSFCFGEWSYANGAQGGERTDNTGQNNNPGGDGGDSPGGGGGDSGPSPSEIARQEAESALHQAEAELSALGPDAAPAQIRAAEAKVAAAQKNYQAATAADAGDPVLVTSGRYLLTETDIELPGSGFALGRVYTSEEKIQGSLGTGWVTGLDSRVIRGRNNISGAAVAAVQSRVGRIKEQADWSYSSTDSAEARIWTLPR